MSLNAPDSNFLMQHGENLLLPPPSSHSLINSRVLKKNRNKSIPVFIRNWQVSRFNWACGSLW